MSGTPARLALALAVLAAVVGTAAGCGSGASRAASGDEDRHGHYAVRGIYGRDGSRSGFAHEAALGFNTIDSGAFPGDLRPLAARGLRAFVWLGGYSNATCRFHRSDAWIRSHVGAVAGDPVIAAYFVDDEPDAARCPSAPAQMRARARLVKSIDPHPVTFIALFRVDQLARFAGTTDVIALDHYPCSRAHGCDFGIIDAQAAEADRLGIRYWGVIQAHGDDWYAKPTPAELHEEFARWRATNMEGYLVFAWRWPPGRPSLWLQNDPALRAQLAVENGA